MGGSQLSKTNTEAAGQTPQQMDQIEGGLATSERPEWAVHQQTEEGGSEVKQLHRIKLTGIIFNE